jgi:hypothetical protein
VQTLTEFVELATKKSELESELKKIEERMRDLEKEGLDWLHENGVSKITVDGKTLFIHSQIWASLADAEVGPQILKDHGLGFLVKEQANTQRLSAWVREQLAEAPVSTDTTQELVDRLDIDPEVKVQLRVGERVSLRVRR